jgi:hypothetical protein
MGYIPFESNKLYSPLAIIGQSEGDTWHSLIGASMYSHYLHQHPSTSYTTYTYTNVAFFFHLYLQHQCMDSMSYV